jgi:hypothetical protein
LINSSGSNHTYSTVKSSALALSSIAKASWGAPYKYVRVTGETGGKDMARFDVYDLNRELGTRGRKTGLRNARWETRLLAKVRLWNYEPSLY